LFAIEKEEKSNKNHSKFNNSGINDKKACRKTGRLSVIWGFWLTSG
jgi:hypothetical protein